MRERPRLLRGEDLPGEPLQARSLEKRKRLKAAGVALFGERGFEGTSVEAIAGRAQLAVGGFYQHFRSKRQLLLVLMDELLEGLTTVELKPGAMKDPRAGLRGLLARAFSKDLSYLGAYRAWQEAVLSDADLARKQEEIHGWTTGRVTLLFEHLGQLPGARQGVDTSGLAQAMDTFFWTLLAKAGRIPKGQLNQQLEAATHLIYHALFTDPPARKRVGAR